MSHQVTLIPGDGIGPEVSSAARRAVDATGVSIDWEVVELNEDVIRKAGVSLPQDVLDSLERTRVGLKGPVTTPIGGGFASVNVALRKRLDLYANVRPVRSLPGVATRFSDVKIDMVIFRENTEDLYSGLEHEVVKDVVTSLKVITRVASIKIAEYAFHYANRLGRKKVAAIHKANIMKLADGLFLRCCREVAARFPHIEYKELIVDNASMQLVMRPETVRCAAAAESVWRYRFGSGGGPGRRTRHRPRREHGRKSRGVRSGAWVGSGHRGKGIANPTAMMLSSVMMLTHLEELEAAKRLQYADREGLCGSLSPDADVGGKATTEEFTNGVIRGDEGLDWHVLRDFSRTLEVELLAIRVGNDGDPHAVSHEGIFGLNPARCEGVIKGQGVFALEANRNAQAELSFRHAFF